MGNALRPASAAAWYMYGLRAESKGDATSQLTLCHNDGKLG